MDRSEDRVGPVERRPTPAWAVLLAMLHPPMVMALLNAYAWRESREAGRADLAVGSNRRAFDRRAKEFRDVTVGFSLMAAFGALVAALAGAWIGDGWGIGLAFASVVLLVHSLTFYVNEVVRDRPMARMSMGAQPSLLLRAAAVPGVAGWLMGIGCWSLL